MSSSSQPRATVHTLGCRLNQAESQVLRDRLERDGYQVVPWGERADLGIINTCTVTREADAKCRKTIRQFIQRNPQAFTAVIGCYSQMGAKAIASIEGVDLIVGNQDKLSVLDHARLGKNERPVILRERISGEDFAVTFVGDLPSTLRANLKIQDGCDFYCSFCIIPTARGRARSRDWDNTLAEARQLAENGVREVVLTGVNLGTYASQGHDLVALVDALDELPGLERIRISSIEPTTVDLALLDRMADPAHALVPYLHLPLQSGSDPILQRMRRKYTVADYAAFVAEAQRRVPGLCLGTDILVGSDGETEAHFQETCDFFLAQPFTYCHVFPYSERKGTLAVKRQEHDPACVVPVEERQQRVARLRRLSEAKRHDFYARYLGQEVEILVEQPREDRWPGYTANYVRVLAEADTSFGDLRNQLVRVRLDRISADFAEGEVVGVAERALAGAV
ncbi:MAG: tRNA (N(6)-L-threonylcarbamoyladenosine(37)-C(2))-methylthiotransferase MtaB [Verrucomicrobiota bacterium JB022]|nr:tRNA (N(6)-L-threonylcarbamoyladenosine(37)-C(2))-methylthiotransferase MtaB [Verrucomicrobiota bacterium JB022]